MSIKELKINEDLVVRLSCVKEGSPLEYFCITGIIKIREKEHLGSVEIPAFASFVPGGNLIPIREAARNAFHKLDCDELILSEEFCQLNPFSMASLTVKKVVFKGAIQTIPSVCFEGSIINEIIFERPEALTEIQERGFAGIAGLNAFNWPCGCKVIPTACFLGAEIGQISGMDEVEEVQTGAFSRIKRLESLIWPPKCDLIPEKCFEHSDIIYVNGVSHVIAVGDGAFTNTANMRKFDWPNNCKVIPYFCFYCSGIEEICNTQNVVEVQGLAFASSRLKKFDLPAVKDIQHHSFINCAFKTCSLGDNKSDALSICSDSFNCEKVDATKYSTIFIKGTSEFSDISYIEINFEAEVNII